MKERMDIDAAIQRSTAVFPFSDVERRTESQPLALSNVASTVLRYLKPGSKILDFGSGACHKAAVLQLLGFRVSAVDNLQDKKPGEPDLLKSFTDDLGIDFRLVSGERGEPLPFDRSSFDMIMMHHVLEHLHDSPRVLLNDLLDLLKPGGFLFVTVPNAGNIRKRIHLLFGKTNMPPFESFWWSPGAWTGHVREYVRDDLVQLSRYLNLKVLELRGIDDLMSLVLPRPSFIRSAYLIATKFFGDWKDTWQLVGRKETELLLESTTQKEGASLEPA